MTFFRRKPLVTERQNIVVIWWRVWTLLALWAVLGVILTVINSHTEHCTVFQFWAVVISCVSYLLSTTALIIPLTRTMK